MFKLEQCFFNPCWSMIVRFYMVILCGTGIIIIQYGMWSLVTNWNGMTTCWKTCVTLSSGGSFLTCKKGLCTDSFCFHPKKGYSQKFHVLKMVFPKFHVLNMDFPMNWSYCHGLGISAIFRQRQVWLYRVPRFSPYILPFTHLGFFFHMRDFGWFGGTAELFLGWKGWTQQSGSWSSVS